MVYAQTRYEEAVRDAFEVLELKNPLLRRSISQCMVWPTQHIFSPTLVNLVGAAEIRRILAYIRLARTGGALVQTTFGQVLRWPAA